MIDLPSISILTIDKNSYENKIDFIEQNYQEIDKLIVISNLSRQKFLIYDDVNVFFKLSQIEENFQDALCDERKTKFLIRNQLFYQSNELIANIILNCQNKAIALVILDYEVAKYLSNLIYACKIFFIVKKNMVHIYKKSTAISEIISNAFNFHQVDSYNFNFDKSIQFMLDKFKFKMSLPFPDSLIPEAQEYDYTELQKFLLPGLFDSEKKCSNCGALCFINSKYKENCCNNLSNIRDHMVTFANPPSFLNEMIDEFHKRPNMFRLINRCCRPIIQRTSINYLSDRYSTLYLNGIPYAIDSRFQFTEPSFLIFNNMDKQFVNWHIKIEDYILIYEICKKIIHFNPILKNYITQSIDKIGGFTKYVAFIQHIIDKGMNLTMIENNSTFQKENPIELILKTPDDNEIVNVDKDNENETENTDSDSEKETENTENDEFINLNNDIENDISNDDDIVVFSSDEILSTEEEIELAKSCQNSNNEVINNLNKYKTKQIFAGESNYDKLIYPLLFWNGEGGCGKLQNELKMNSQLFRYSIVSMCMQNPNYYFNKCSALKEEFICSAYGRFLQLRINYQYNLQKQLFMQKEINSNFNRNELKFGIKTYVPASFTGSYQYWKKVSNQGFYMTLILGPPKFFVTITFNPNWNEIKALNTEPQIINNSPLIARTFNQKKHCFIDFIKKKKIFGNIEGILWRVEYQQRGYPHCHILLWSDFDTDDVTKLDKILTCKLPIHDNFEENNEKWEILKNLSRKYMTHNCTSRCKGKDGLCSYGYPKEQCEKTHYDNNGNLIYARGPDDSWIVPHSPELLSYYRAHVEVEAIHSEKCIGYVLKYVAKNSDTAEVSIKENKYCGQKIGEEDFLHKYASSRVVSAVEAFSSLAGYNRYGMSPSISIISVHLPGERIISIPPNVNRENWLRDNTLSSSKLERYFLRPSLKEFDDIKLCDYFGIYSLTKSITSNDQMNDKGVPINRVHKKKNRSYCSIETVDPSKHEKFALRLLLLNYPARSYEHLLTVDDVVYQSFYEAALHKGLVGDCNEYFICIEEAIETNRPPSDIRFMIALFAQQGAPLKKMINNYEHYISQDLVNTSLYSVMATLLDQMHMIVPEFLGNDIVCDEIRLNKKIDCAKLNILQKFVVKFIYEKIVSNDSNQPNLLFLQGRAGTGKTYTTNVLINILRKHGYKVLVTGTTGIAATQYEHGMTCHSLFKLKIEQSIKGNEFICNIGYGTHRAKELLKSNLIIIDEISMLTIETAQSIDYTLRSLVGFHINNNQNLDEIPPFGGKNILFVGDLLQLPPVVVGSTSSVSNKLITKCPFWSSVQCFGLKEAVRCINTEWNSFLVEIGNGKSKKYETWFDLKKDFQLTITRDYKEAVNFFIEDIDIKEKFPIDRQWICATNSYVQKVNDYFHMLRLNKNSKIDLGPIFASTTISTIFESENINKKLSLPEAFDYLNVMKFRDIPNYRLDLALGEPMCLMRNINTAKGMAKNKRCYVVGKNQNCVIIEFENNEKVTLPRINFPGETNGIIFTRHQIPLRPIYAGTIHKSQGLTLKKVVVDMRSEFWEHGQLYVALSRIKDPKNLCILLPESENENDCLIKPISDDAIVSLVNEVENQNYDLNYIENWEITNNEPIYKVRGLIKFYNMVNYGSTSYLNSILHVFFQIRFFRESVIKYQLKNETFPNNNILIAFKKIFSEMNVPITNDDYHLIDTLCILEVLGLENKLTECLDAHEILSRILNLFILSDLKYLMLSFKFVQLTKTFSKKLSKYTSSSIESFFSLSINQETNSSIKAEIRKRNLFFTKIDNYNRKISYFNHLPRVMIIHINRYEYDNAGQIKAKKINNFQIDDDVEVYNHFEQKYHKYKLFAIILHTGNLNNCNYSSLIKFYDNATNYIYVHFDRQYIKEIKENEFYNISNGFTNNNSCAYLAFYIKEQLYFENIRF